MSDAATARTETEPSVATLLEAGLPPECARPFDRLPPGMIVRAFGVTYGHVQPKEGGDLYVTHYGWPSLPQLLPSTWYAEQRYARLGTPLPGSGHVYRVITPAVNGKSADLVVKFSRVAREVSLEIANTFPDDFPPEIIANARFNSPMEEFGLVMELRRGAFRSDRPHVLTQRPLAIYAPPEEFELWQLGRDHSRFEAHSHLLAQDQGNAPKAIEFDIKRVYVLLYGWIKGEDAEQALCSGDITEQECNRLTLQAIQDLRANGFRVLDNKPKHFILRKSAADGRIVRRADRILYALVDFELLQRTGEYQSRFSAAQREKYWHLQAHSRQAPAEGALPSHLRRTDVLGVDYVFGEAPNGGRLWVVGNDGELFDYFVPDRWRRTPRSKLSAVNEVYHTRTRDGIHVLYRRSRVGLGAAPDSPDDEKANVRDHGYNSPFEEISIAQRLRDHGVLAIYPRAVYRTAHPSNKAAVLPDQRRFDSHAGLSAPGPTVEPLLSPTYDYYTIWGYFRGIDPEIEHRHHASVSDLDQAYKEGLVDRHDYERTVASVKWRLHALAFDAGHEEPSEYALSIGADGRPRRDPRGDIDVRLCINAETARRHGLLGENDYRELLERFDGSLRAAGYRMLNLSGHHLLLSMRPGGEFDLDDGGYPSVVLCNFELIEQLGP